MKIKLVNFPFDKFKVGEVCDFGEERNASLVGMGRAVWDDGGKAAADAEKAAKAALKEKVNEKPVVTETPSEEEQAPTNAETTPVEDAEEVANAASGKKLLTNDLQEKVQKRKEQIKTTPLRGPGGKFLSKKEQAETQPADSNQQKKGFWDKLKG
jgi:hypothetical protein